MVLRRITAALAGFLGWAGARRWLLGRSLPPRHEELRLPDCRGPILVRIDRWGVPHIEAEHAADVFLAQGYCHARDRFWQMELNRRTACGELAELFGSRATEFDRISRRLGFRRLAEREADHLDPEVQGIVAAYTAGINAYLQRHRLPIELVIMRRRPVPWRIADSLAFARFMGFAMTAGWDSKLVQHRLQEAVGVEAAAALAPRLVTAKERELGLLAGGASNNWAVAPSRSSSGRPILANDPHLRPSLPGPWHLSHLHGGGYNVIGATLPGLPGLLIGHNQHIAWGLTAAATAGQDLYLEKSQAAPVTSGAAQPRRRFAGPAGWYDPVVLIETIAVRRRPPVVEEVVLSRHGPLLNGVLNVPVEAAPLCLRSVTDSEPCPTRAVLQLNRATDWPSCRAALANWTFPALSFVYADVAGTIACKLAGRVPLRKRSDNSGPVAGWTDEHDWLGTVPFDDLPEAVNPEEGIVATANNQPSVPCRHFLGNNWLDRFRYERILQLLRSRPRHSLADMEAMHNDLVSLPARVVASGLLGQFSRRQQPALAFLEGWDGRLEADSVAASIYQVFRHELVGSAARGLPPALAGYLQGQGVHEMLGLSTVFHAQASSLVLRLLEGRLKQEQGKRQVEEALQSALDWLRARLGPAPEGWQWGRLHQISFQHVLGRASPALERCFRLSRGPFPVGGDSDTIAQSGIDPWHPFAAATFTVSYRQIIDVGDWDQSRCILPTGQSGHAGSPHYDDMLPLWRRGEYVPLWFSEEAITRETQETIRLQPEGRL